MNILARAPSTPYVQVAGGTFTQANSRLSLVDGTAFFDCGADLSAYAGLDTGSHEYLIKVYDDDGYSIQGYVGAVGGGVAYNTLIDDDCTADNTGDWALSDCALNFVAANGDVAHYTLNYVAYSQYIYKMQALTEGKLYKGGLSVRDGTTSGVVVTLFLYPPQLILRDQNTTALWADLSGHAVADGSVDRIRMSCNMDSGNFKIKDILLQELTDCAATGFHIISAQGGSTQNWTSESASFKYNDDNYSYKIYKVR